MSVTYSTVFTPATQQILKERGFTGRSQPEQWLPQGIYPVAGDLYAEDRISAELMFVVVNRLFAWDGDGNLNIQLLLDVLPSRLAPTEEGRSGIVLAFRAPDSPPSE